MSSHIAESIKTNCRMFRPHCPLSTVYKTHLTQAKTFVQVLYKTDKGLRGQNVLVSVVIDSAAYLLMIN